MTDYESRLRDERERFDREVNVHDLPEIFHYWSNKYLRPMLNHQGYDNIEDFFAQEIFRSHGNIDRTVNIVSVGSGDCANEIEVAKRLEKYGVKDFAFRCLDISGGALQRGSDLADAAGLLDHFSFSQHDFNKGLDNRSYDIVIANQSLHHVVELEVLFDQIHDAIGPSGAFLISDMIGRNGHQRWPEARVLVDYLWSWLPTSYRFNRQLSRQEDVFLDWDCSQEGFEGVRAEDILELLLEKFQANAFFAWGNIIDTFIDRGFGHSFHRCSEWDLFFIDKVHHLDAAAIECGSIKPVHMLARFQRESQLCRHFPNLSPRQALRKKREF